ncbi:hypothetical protein B0H13DRAFT_1877621 [Mycena leptocephala]|nr:hypothetical protein B0H13DRAFT_1877621 [Mycena leptocephala]
MSGTLYPSRTVVRINPATDSRETRWNERLIPDRRKEGDERIWINEKDTHRSASVSRLQKGAREDVTDPDVCGSIEQTRFRVDGGSLCGGYELGASTQATIPRCQEGQKLLVGRYCSLRMKTGRNADPMSGSPASLPIAFGTSQRQDHIGTIPEHSLEGSGHCECRIRTGGKLVNGNKHWLCPVQSLAKLESPDESENATGREQRWWREQSRDHVTHTVTLRNLDAAASISAKELVFNAEMGKDSTLAFGNRNSTCLGGIHIKEVHIEAVQIYGMSKRKRGMEAGNNGEEEGVGVVTRTDDGGMEEMAMAMECVRWPQRDRAPSRSAWSCCYGREQMNNWTNTPGRL